MTRYSSEKEDESVNPGSVVIVLTMLMVLVGSFVSLIVQGVKTSRFDKDFESGLLNLNPSYILLGGNGIPNSGNIPEWLPKADETIVQWPRLYLISGCESLSLEEDVKGLYATTPYFSPEVIQISVPPQSSGTVNVCVPEGIEVQVVMWTDQ